MRNELKRHKKIDGMKWTITGIVLFLICVAVVGMGLQLFGKGKQKPSEWFKKQEQSEQKLPEKESQKTSYIQDGFVICEG